MIVSRCAKHLGVMSALWWGQDTRASTLLLTNLLIYALQIGANEILFCGLSVHLVCQSSRLILLLVHHGVEISSIALWVDGRSYSYYCMIKLLFVVRSGDSFALAAWRVLNVLWHFWRLDLLRRVIKEHISRLLAATGSLLAHHHGFTDSFCWTWTERETNCSCSCLELRPICSTSISTFSHLLIGRSCGH